MYYGTQVGPMWGVERFVVAAAARRTSRRGLVTLVAGFMLASSLITAPGAAADPLLPDLRDRDVLVRAFEAKRITIEQLHRADRDLTNEERRQARSD